MWVKDYTVFNDLYLLRLAASLQLFEMKGTIKEMGKQLFSILRLVSFFPVSLLAGAIAKDIFGTVIQVTTFGQVSPHDYWEGSAVFTSIVSWALTYYLAWWIKPNFLSPKGFTIFWIFILGIFVVLFLNGAMNPPYDGYPIQQDFWKTIIPAVTLIWFVKDKKSGLYALEEKRFKK